MRKKGEVRVDKGIPDRKVNLFNYNKVQFMLFCVSVSLSTTLKLLELQGCSSVVDSILTSWCRRKQIDTLLHRNELSITLLNKNKMLPVSTAGISTCIGEINCKGSQHGGRKIECSSNIQTHDARLCIALISDFLLKSQQSNVHKNNTLNKLNNNKLKS